MEDAVVPQFVEIIKSNKMTLDADLCIGDREQHALNKRIGDKQPEQDDRWQQQDRGEPTLVLKRPGNRAAAWQRGITARGCGMLDRRHRASLSLCRGKSGVN